MAVIAGLTVANCYYNQPLLEMIRHDIGVSQHEANLITVVTQTGYALGLCSPYTYGRPLLTPSHNNCE